MDLVTHGRLRECRSMISFKGVKQMDWLELSEISFEISELDLPLKDIIEAVEAKYPEYKFNRTEPRYKSCIMAIFERRG